jgi:hypothetical protein
MATTIIGKLNQADILLHFLFPRSWHREEDKEEDKEEVKEEEKEEEEED